MPKTFFTLDNGDGNNTAHDSEVLRFYDRSSAEDFLKLINDIGNNCFNDYSVAEHEIKET